MATNTSTPEKRKIEEADDLSGYILEVSEMRQTPGKKAYFNASLETAPGEVSQLVGWNRIKRNLLKEFQLSETAIKMSIPSARCEVQPSGVKKFKLPDAIRIEGCTTLTFESKCKQEQIHLNEPQNIQYGIDYGFTGLVLEKAESNMDYRVVLKEISDARESLFIVLELTENTFKNVAKNTVVHFSAVRLVAAEKMSLKESVNCTITLRTMKEEISGEDVRKAVLMLRDTIKIVTCVGVTEVFEGLLCPTCNKVLLQQETDEEILHCHNCKSIGLRTMAVFHRSVGTNFKTVVDQKVFSAKLTEPMLTKIDVNRSDKQVDILKKLVKAGKMNITLKGDLVVDLEIATS